MGMMLGLPFGIRMWKCKKVAEFLADYLDGELSDAERRSIDLHVFACEDCQNFLRTYRYTGDLVRALPYEEIPAEFRQRLGEVLTQRLRGT
jgi:anti-sigma factor RsiW